jgi:hypothetical protein
MKSKWLLLPGFALVLLLMPPAVGTWRKAQDEAMRSCIASVHQGIASLDSPLPKIADLGSQWKILNDAEREQLVSAAWKVHSFDCSRTGSREFLRDNWGHPIEVGVRQINSEGQLEFRVWSKGRDGLSGTADDLVSPYGERALGPQ